MLLKYKSLFILIVVLVIVGLNTQGYCQSDNVALLLQQSPADGGTVTPEAGVHNYELNTPITLTAVPKQGYQFVYWIGDVTDPTESTTMAYLDSPKIIIAVFERSEYEFLAVELTSTSIPFGGLRGSAVGIGGGGGGGGGGRRPSGNGYPSTPPEEPEPEEPLEDFPSIPDQEDQIPDFPAEGDDNIPVPGEPIPEPATFILLSLGSLGLLRNRNRGRKLNCL